ncbi:hypothetical protein IW261DRAFT_1491578 [Armillaria novae-zelandiae]|uniref:Uncharacterized protein n=1 Tax=Armillaria novae-zelandiae TaxID=153914 RepID=A0AA39P2K9_9AGAR|nr:hypothetical protein IW261DRAFT_1491578 [Armillaria novae-zelandiae]
MYYSNYADSLILTLLLGNFDQCQGMVLEVYDYLHRHCLVDCTSVGKMMLVNIFVLHVSISAGSLDTAKGENKINHKFSGAHSRPTIAAATH